MCAHACVIAWTYLIPAIEERGEKRGEDGVRGRFFQMADIPVV